MRRDVFQAIADPTRREILSLIVVQAMTPNMLAEHFDSSRQAVAKHIKILTECDLLTQETVGREVFCHLNASKMKELDDWLEPFRKEWEANSDRLDDVIERLKNNRAE